MRRLVLLFSFFFVLVVAAYSQPWLMYLPKNKSKGSLTLKDYQKAFELYVKDYTATHKIKFTGELSDEGQIPGYFQFKRWEWYWEPRVDLKTGAFPDVDLFQIVQQVKAKYPKSAQGTWTSLGPANVNQDDRGTGRNNCAAFDPNDDNHIWVGAASGGLWETTDGGATWHPLTDGLPTLGISDIALPPDYDASTNPTIYIGTGDRDALDDPSIGILVTHDGGQTWQQTGLKFKLKDQQYVSRVIINPNDKNVMWAATSVGIFKSTDAGDTWSLILSGNFIDMELFPGSTANGGEGRLLASTNGYEPKIYLSTDGGQSWTKTYDASSYDGTQFRADVAVTPADPNVAYFIMSDYDNSYAFEALFRSSDGGQTWTEVFNQNDNNLFGWNEQNDPSAGGQGFYDIALAVSNNNPDLVYVGGVNGFISTDGGKSFTLSNEWSSSVGDADVVHADHHNAYFRPSDDWLFDCDDGGFYYTKDPADGKNSTWNNLTAGKVCGQIYGIGVGNQQPGVVVAGFQDNGTKLLDQPNTGNNNWADVKGGDGMNCDIDPTDDDVQWGTYVQLQVSMTTNRWSSYSDIRSQGNAAWAGPLVADPIDAQTVYIGTDAVEKHEGTSTASSSWTNLSGSLDNQRFLRALDVYHDGSGNLVIWTASPSGVWRSDNNGGNFVKVNQNGLPNDFVTDIAIDPNDYKHVYVCMGGYDTNVVYETFDQGQTWHNISVGLPQVPAGAIAVNKQNTTVKEVYVGTDAGIYVKYGDNPWQLFNNGMPFVSITDLEFFYDDNDPSNTKLYASTYGRGVWVSDCYQPPSLDLALYKIEEPLSDYCEPSTVQPTFDVANQGENDVTSFSIHYKVDGGSVQTINWSGTLSQYQKLSIQFSNLDVSYGQHSLVAWIDDINGGSDDVPANDTLHMTFNVWDNRLPYTQTFDNFDVNIGYNGTSVGLQECWVNDENESSLDWSVTMGSTPSANTGPTGDYTGGGKYLYTEVSGISDATVANVLSPIFDFSQWQNVQLKFYYYMYGQNCGTLGPVSVSTDGGNTWTDLDVTWESTGNTTKSISGNQGQQWYSATADLSAYDGQSNILIRIQSTTGTNYDGDIAIDQFSLSGDPVCTPPDVQVSNLSATADYNSITLNWERGNGDSVIVVAKQGSAVDQDPVSGNVYQANSTFGSGDVTGPGNYVVYVGTGTNVTVTGLQEGTDYYFAVYEFYGSDHCYKVPGETVSAKTLVHPPQISSVSPSYLYADLGANLTISGDYFNNVTAVTLGDVNASSFNVNSSSEIVASFDAAAYKDDTLKVITSSYTAFYIFDLRTRNIIPVGTGSDMHSTISDALAGLQAWWGNNAFDTTKVIDVYSGTYTETIKPQNYNLSPDATNMLALRAHTAETPVIDANGLDYGFYNTLDNVEISGFTVKDANLAGIYTSGDNNKICFNNVNGTVSGSGIVLDNALSSQVCNNLVYKNYNDGIQISASDNTTVKNNTAFANGHFEPSITNIQLFTEDFDSNVSKWVYSGDGTWAFSDRKPHSGTYAAEGWDASLYKKYAIDVSPGYDNITLSFWMATYSSDVMEPDDSLTVFYSYDKNNWVRVASYNDDHSTYEQYTYSLGPTQSDSLYLRFTSYNTTERDEYWEIDDISVTGDIYGNGSQGAGLDLVSGSNYTVKNNILTSKNASGYYSLIIGESVGYTNDYNLYYNWGNDSLIKEGTSSYASLNDWPNAGSNEIEVDPLFIDTTNFDFHIQSAEGSYHGGNWPPLAEIGGTWTNDDATSPALDAGDPSDDYSNEPQSGNRINLGAFGNTVQASKSKIIQYVWTGDVDTLWSKSGNWSTSKVPDDKSDVIIPSGLSNYPSVDVESQAQSVTLEDGASLKVYQPLTVGNSVDLGSQAGDSAVLYIANSLSAGQINVNGLSTVIFANNYSLNAPVNFGSTSYAVYQGTDQNIVNLNYANLIIENTGSKIVQGTATNPTTCENLTIKSGANITIPETKALEVTGNLVNNNGYDGLLIKSSTLGDGSLIQQTDNVLATVQRYWPGTQWHYISAPVKGADRSLFTEQNFYIWDATAEWGGVDDASPWKKYSADTLITGLGYAYYYYATTVTFEDTLTTETYQFTLHRSATGDTSNQGWNLLGNPYVAALDWDKVITQPAFANGQIEYAVYLYDDSKKTGEQSNYRYYVPSVGKATGVGTGDASHEIPMGQGFFVKAYKDGVNFVISPDYRTFNTGTDFYKVARVNKDPENILRLQIKGDSSSDELVYRLVADATPNFDYKYDARKRFPGKSLNQFYIISQDEKSKQAIASDAPNTNYRDIKLGYYAQDSVLSIEIKSSTFDVPNVYLEDKLLDSIVDLEETSYEFTTEVGKFVDDRFVLHFGLNRPPEARVSELYAQTQENNRLSVKIPEFKDPDFGDSVVSISISILPAWLKYDSKNRLLYGLPTDKDTGNYTINFTATDTRGAAGKLNVHIKVLNINNPPYVDGSLSDISVEAGITYTCQIPRLVKDNDVTQPISYFIITQDGGSLPEFMSFDPVSMKFTVSPKEDDEGTYHLYLVGQDPYGSKALVPFNVYVYKTVTKMNNSDLEFGVYPNPVVSNINIWSEDEVEIHKINILSENGKLIKTVDKIAEQPVVIPANDLASGVYVLQIFYDKNKVFVAKFTKQ